MFCQLFSSDQSFSWVASFANLPKALCLTLGASFALLATPATYGQTAAHPEVVEKSEGSGNEAKLLAQTRQITFAGRKAGEGYFSADGKTMVFQSEREEGNPFYQIYKMDMETADITRESTGTGKTTCAWIDPVHGNILFSSTHTDPQAVEKQKAEIALRAKGEQRRYSWDYDPHYDLFAKSSDTGELTQLTSEEGYDAEGSYSPDGSQIAFASNRQAYNRKLTEREQHLFDQDPASMMEIYIMNADGSNVRQLTDTLGYDGGPFFSPDGSRICWRRFTPDGASAEIYTMRVDGTDQRRLTNLQAMSWAPYYHPSGDYLIFTTNVQGFDNFELYMVRADGAGEPVRVTDTPKADLLPVFLPSGKQLSWTSTRTDSGRSQIFIADWNDAEARKLLGIEEGENNDDDRSAALASAGATSAGFSPADIGRHVDYLTRAELNGRLTGTDGERRATAYVAAYLESLGFLPAGRDGSWFQEFEFPAGSERTAKNHFSQNDQKFVSDKQWRPLSFSGNGDFDSAELVFAGYGLQVPGTPETEYDSYVHLDVAGKWVVVLRDLPQDITADERQRMARYSDPRRKAAVARDHGARGIIFVTGPTSKVRNRLMRFDRDASQASVSIAVISVTDEVAMEWFKSAGKNLQEVQKSLDGGEPQMGFVLANSDKKSKLQVSATIDILRKTGIGRNVVGRLPVAKTPTEQIVIVGAHVDHLGRGAGSNSLASENEQDQVHFGADDNASGVGAMLEVAQSIASQVRSGQLKAKRDLVIAAWSGEELGLFGSQAFVTEFNELFPYIQKPAVHPHAAAHAHAHADTDGDAHADADADAKKAAAPPTAHGAPTDAQSLYPGIAAYLNLDMVGRLREKLIVQGIGSSPAWEATVQRRNGPVGLAMELDKTSSRLPTDAASFVSRGVPILAFFTGAHEDYHTPRDTADKLNYEGASQIANLTALIARGLLQDDQPIPFEMHEGEQAEDAPRVRLTAYLGTIPDYAQGDIKGLKLSGVAKRGPAEQAGLRGGDIIVELAGRKIENIYDYTYAIEALKIGEPVKAKILRDGKQIERSITPGSRD
ncbi:Putative zinc metalloprotease [Roseimaritima multifibrata]|uniref:Zinc metalloprotease n=1 Tax=Roseimaritima multifibrata TaxID=1930274 RepID=A0A517MJD5_9BACT|nr:Putative zinc metalloprotease [Roseimaritima multifibrata]